MQPSPGSTTTSLPLVGPRYRSSLRPTTTSAERPSLPGLLESCASTGGHAGECLIAMMVVGLGIIGIWGISHVVGVGTGSMNPVGLYAECSPPGPCTGAPPPGRVRASLKRKPEPIGHGLPRLASP